MRLATAALVLLGLASLRATVQATANEAFPYAALVAKDRSPVRSGPSDEHYVTGRLDRGETVEVYRRTEDGWLGIRPPSGSFSWVPQRDVALTQVSGVGEVTGRAAVSWIGSAVDEVADHHWLVKLDVGEAVSILGQDRRIMVSGDRSDIYYRIAPPSGEFRWIHEADVVRGQGKLPIVDPDVAFADFRVPLGKKGQDVPIRKEPANPPVVPRRDDFMGRGADSSSAPPAARVSRLEKQPPEPPLLRGATSSFDAGLRELEARLSLLVAEPVEKWEFSQLVADAEHVAARANATLERARVQVFRDKIQEFESLKSRHALFADTKNFPAPDSQRGGLPAADPAAVGQDAQADPYHPRFDGSGWLLPVHSTKRAAPPYALLDREGNILQFVSPAPGLNLNRYLRKEVGIFGQKEPRTTLDKPHLTAHRVVELDRHRPAQDRR